MNTKWVWAAEFEIVINSTGVQRMGDLDQVPDLTVLVHFCHMIHFLFRSFITCQCLVHHKTVQHGRFGIHQYQNFLSYSKELSVFLGGGAHDNGHSLGLEWRRWFQNSDSDCWWLCHLHWLAGLIWHFDVVIQIQLNDLILHGLIQEHQLLVC